MVADPLRVTQTAYQVRDRGEEEAYDEHQEDHSGVEPCELVGVIHLLAQGKYHPYSLVVNAAYFHREQRYADERGDLRVLVQADWPACWSHPTEDEADVVVRDCAYWVVKARLPDVKITMIANSDT